MRWIRYSWLIVILAIMVLGSVPAISGSTQDTAGPVYVTFNINGAQYVTLGHYSGITVNVTSPVEPLSIVVYATFKENTAIYVADGTTTIGYDQTVFVFMIDLQSFPPGTYSVTFAAVTTSDNAVSAPTTPISIVVPT